MIPVLSPRHRRGTLSVPRYLFVFVSITLTPLLTRSAKYKVFVAGSKDQTSVLACVAAPVAVQFGMVIFVRNSKPASGVGVSAMAFSRFHEVNAKEINIAAAKIWFVFKYL